MSIRAIITLTRALLLWPFMAGVFLGLVWAGVVHGPWNYCWFMAMGCWLVLDAYWVMGTQTTKPVISPEQFRRAVLTSMTLHLLYCLPLSSVPVWGWPILPRLMALKILGVVLCVTGVSIAIWARRVLAGNWNAAVGLQQQHALVQTGPYALVRHPIYLGFFLMALGMILALGEVRALILLNHVSQFFIKMRSEEAILRVTYPDAYADYERRTKRLVPGIW